MKRAAAFLLIANLMLNVGCSIPSRWTADQAARLIESGTASYEQEPDLDLVARSLPSQIKLLETLLAGDPTNQRLLILLAQHYGLYAFGFADLAYEQHLHPTAAPVLSPAVIQGDLASLQRKLNRYFLRGAEFALNALETMAPSCRNQLSQADSRRKWLDTLGKEAVPALFWYAFNLSGYIHRNLDSVEAIAQTDTAVSVMQRAVSLAPDYQHGMGHLMLMVYYGGRSPLAGGDLNRAERHYRQLRHIAGSTFRLAPLFYARTVMVQRQDVQRYRRLLEPLIEAVPEDDPLALYNAMGRQRARFYLRLIDDLFL